MATRKRGPRRGAGQSARDDGATVIRKYPNRRLYDTETGAFVTLEDLRKMVVAGHPFVVEDAKEGKDITPSILAQIIAEQESRGESVLPGDLMRRLIAFYDQGLPEGFFRQLQDAMDAFAKNWRPFEAYGAIGKRNVELMRKSYETFFGGFDPNAKKTAATSESRDAGEPADMAALQTKLNDLQAEIDALRASRGPRRRKP